MRAILIDWLIDVHKKFKLRSQTLFMAVNIIDRILEKVEVAKHRFQLLGITGLFIASKYEEIYPPELERFSYVCADAYTNDDLLQMESKVLELLDFNLVFTSSYNLFLTYSKESKFCFLTPLVGLEPKEYCFGNFSLFSSLLESKLMKKNAAEIAAGCIMLLNKVFGKNFSINKLAKDFDIDVKGIKECSLLMFFNLVESKKSELKACRRKFNTDEYFNVGSFQIKLDN